MMARAAAMASYLKTDMAFFGVSSADRKTITRRLKSELAPLSNGEYRAQISELWEQPWRETRYLAIAVARLVQDHHEVVGVTEEALEKIGLCHDDPSVPTPPRNNRPVARA